MARYAFAPQRNITAYELAGIIVRAGGLVVDLSDEEYAGLEPVIKQHLTQAEETEMVEAEVDDAPPKDGQGA